MVGQISRRANFLGQWGRPLIYQFDIHLNRYFTLNAKKTKELIEDLQKSNSSSHFLLYINGIEVEHVSSFRFLGVIYEDLSWHHNTVQYSLEWHNWDWKKVHLPPKVFTSFCCCSIQSNVTNSITSCYGSSMVSEQKGCWKLPNSCAHWCTTPSHYASSPQ